MPHDPATILAECERPKFPCQLAIERHTDANEPYWWPVCTVYDNEALGFLERLFQERRYKVKAS